MLLIFIGTVFIAQLIVTAKVISVLRRASVTVCDINKQVTEIRPVVTNGLNSASKGIKSAANGVAVMTRFLEKRKRVFWASVIKCLLGLAVFMLIKKYPHKRFLSFIDVIFNFDSLMA